jgi:F0F1-type ATP synthase delta subunit
MQSLTRATAQLAAARRMPALAARGFAAGASKGKKSAPAPGKAEANGMTLEFAIANAHGNDDLAAIFDSIDAAGNSDISIQSRLPVTLTGSSAAYVEQAFEKVNGDMGKLGTTLSSLRKVYDAVMARDYSVHRFFMEPDYLPAETSTAMNLLMTNDVALNKLDAIKDDDLREYFLVDENIAQGEWGVARKAIKDAKVDAVAADTLQTMAAEGKTHLLGRIIEGLEAVMAAASSVATVQVTSATELSAAQKKDVEAAAKTFLPAGKSDMQVKYAVDSAVMGGLVLQLDDVSVDLSSAALTLAMSEAAGMTSDRA